MQFFFDLFFKSIRLFCKLINKKGENVCLISIHKLGDSIFTFDAINSIKEFYRKDIFIICHYNSKDIYTLIHPENLTFPISKESFHFNDRYLDSRARKLLRKLNPDIIIDLTGVMTSVSLIFNSKARRIIGMNRKIFRSVYDDFIEVNTNLNSIEIYINAIKNFIPISRLKINEFDSTIEVKKILFSPFAGWKSKEWGLGKFIMLAEKLKNDYEVEFIFDDTPVSNEILSYLQQIGISYYSCKSIKELIEKIKSGDMLIGNDSGPIYIASHLGKKTFSIFGPTNPGFHISINEQNKFIQKKLLCSPKSNERFCFTDGGKAGCPSFECMNLLSLDEVYSYLKSEVLK